MILNRSAHVLLNLKKTQQTIKNKIDPGTQKIPGNVKCNKTITALHLVQYDVLWSTSYYIYDFIQYYKTIYHI
jgi:hypothetical protein